VVVPLSGDFARARDEARRRLGAVEPVIFPVGQLADGGRRVLRDRSYERLALVGAPPKNELGYAFCTLIAILGRPRRVTLVDLDREDVVTDSVLRYVARSAPFAVGQLGGSALSLCLQRAAIPIARRAPHVRGLRPELKKLVYLLPGAGGSPVGGSVTHTHEVIRALRASGIEVDAFTSNAAIATTATRESEPPCQWRVVDTPRAAKAIAASAAAGADAALLRAAHRAAGTADAIYQRHVRFSLVGPLLAHLSGKPLILEYNGSEEFASRHWNPTTPLGWRIAACENAALAAAARIVVVSEVDYRSLLKRGIEPERIVLNPNGVDATRFALGGGSEVRRRHGIADHRLLVGFVGSFGPWHGAPTLARAFVDAAGRTPELHLLLVGDGSELEQTLGILRAAGLEAQVTVTGQVPPGEIPAHLDACDILVAPHVPLPGGVEFYGSPTKLFEYMAAGKAIIASRLGQIGDVLEHGVTALLVDPGDEGMLAEALHTLADASGLRLDLGAKARQQAIERHSWRLNARRVIDAYADVAEARP
jgi:glycosyltransferase involved in cell wall biosynthesis